MISSSVRVDPWTRWVWTAWVHWNVDFFFSIDHSSLGPHNSSPRCFKVTWQLGTHILGRWVMTYILYPDFELHRWPVPLTLYCSRINKLISRYFLSIYFTSFFFCFVSRYTFLNKQIQLYFKLCCGLNYSRLISGGVEIFLFHVFVH